MGGINAKKHVLIQLKWNGFVVKGQDMVRALRWAEPAFDLKETNDQPVTLEC